jgi:hypothetical protein
VGDTSDADFFAFANGADHGDSSAENNTTILAHDGQWDDEDDLHAHPYACATPPP